MDKLLSTTELSRLRNKKIFRFVGIIFIFSILFYGFQWAFMPSAQRSTLRIAKVELGSITATINASGIVVPASEKTLSSETNTRIVKVLAQLGQYVKKHAPILRLETRSINLSIENINENIALKETQIEAKKFHSKKEINQINSQYQLLEVELERHSVKANRVQQLTITGAAAKHDLLEAKLNVKRTEIEIKQLKQSILDIKASSQAEIKGLNLEKSILNKSLKEKQRLLAGSTITANRDGVLSWIKNEEGANVVYGEPLAKIADTKKFRVEANLSDFYASQLKPGMKVVVSYNELRLKAQLETLSPTIENGVMKLIVMLDEPNNPQLQQNVRVDVGFVTDEVAQANTLSKGPFISGKGFQEVFVIRNNIAIKTEVEVGLSNRNRYQIIRGLNPGDEVIISDVSHYIHLKEFTIN